MSLDLALNRAWTLAGLNTSSKSTTKLQGLCMPLAARYIFGGEKISTLH